MALREGCTADNVGRRLVAAFAALPSQPVYSSGRRLAGADAAFAWGERFLRGRRDAWLCLLTWARAAAVPGSPSAAEFCREFGIPRSSFERRRRAAAAAIAAGLAAEIGCDARSAPLDTGKTAPAAWGGGDLDIQTAA